MHPIALAKSNFDTLFAGVRDDVVRDVIAAFADEDRQEEAQAARLRQDVGRANQSLPNFWTTAGVPTVRVTADDYWRQQIRHHAVGDPELWHWFVRQPEGEYARVRSQSPKLVLPFCGTRRMRVQF